MKKLIMLAAFIAAAASLSAGTKDDLRPSWAPQEPDHSFQPNGQIVPGGYNALEVALYLWARNNHIVSQYDTLDEPFYLAPDNLTRLGPLHASAPNTLTDDQQAEIDELNRRVEIAMLKVQKHNLSRPRVALTTPPVVDKEKTQLAAIDELKTEIASLKEYYAKRDADQKKKEEEAKQAALEAKSSDDTTSLSTPVVATMAGLGGLSLASLFGLAFMRRGVVS